MNIECEFENSRAQEDQSDHHPKSYFGSKGNLLQRIEVNRTFGY